MKNFYKYFNYGSIILVLILLILMLTKAVPSESFVYLIGLAIFLFIIRLIFRIYFLIQIKKSNKE